MYNIIKNVIGCKKYELRDMLKKLDVFWVQGSITDEERAELVALAQNNAQTANSVDILAKMEELDKRLKALEEKMAINDSTGDEDSGEEFDGFELVTYPAYEAGKWYYSGDIVEYEGGNYICTAPENTVCVWSPNDYPAYWSVYNT